MRETNNLFGDVRMVHEEAVDLTLQSLRAYWGDHQHVAIAWSGGKDSTALVVLVVHFIKAGLLSQPERLYVFLADTRMENPALQAAVDAMIEKLRQHNWIEVIVAVAPLDKRFMVYMLGRGVPPPNNKTLRWCTRQIKVEPMAAVLEEVLSGLPGKVLMLTGVRLGESAVRDDRITLSCSKDGGECGQGWYQEVLPNAKGIRGRIATLAPLLHWRVCIVWDLLKIYAPMPEFGSWPTAILAEAYGGDEAEEENARFGCTGCALIPEDKALQMTMKRPGWEHLSPLQELGEIYRWLRLPAQRHRKAGAEKLKSGALGKNPQRMGPITLEARSEALERILDIQRRARVDFINAEEEARIRELIAARTFPEKWEGDEPRADLWLDTVHQDGSVQPILFRDLVGS